MNDKKAKNTAAKLGQTAALVALGVSIGVSAAPLKKMPNGENLQPEHVKANAAKAKQPKAQQPDAKSGAGNGIKADGPPRP